MKRIRVNMKSPPQKATTTTQKNKISIKQLNNIFLNTISKTIPGKELQPLQVQV